MTEKAARLEHIRGHLDKRFEPGLIGLVIDNLKRNFNVANSAGILASYAEAKAMYAWFSDHDLVWFRRWASASARYSWKSLRTDHESILPYPLFLEMLWPLLSNDKDCVVKFVDFADAFLGSKKLKPKQDEFLLRQFINAWRGNWAEIEGACDEIARGDYLSVKPIHQSDYMFLNAIALGDDDDIRGALYKMLEKKELNRNANYESGYTCDLISSKAVIWCKIARLHGVELNIEADLIPSEWMPWDSVQYPPIEEADLIAK